jgi:hypothetical protein
MKKVLLIGLILAILLFAFPQGVMAADTDSDTAEVTADINDVCEVTATYVGGTWALDRNSGTSNLNDDAISVTVDSTSPFDLMAEDMAGTANDGFMVSGVIPLKTGFILEGFAAGALAGPVTVINDHAPQDASVEPAFLYDIAQQVTDDDDSSKTYSITVTFTLNSV